MNYFISLKYYTEEDFKKIKKYADVLGPDFRELTHEKVKFCMKTD